MAIAHQPAMTTESVRARPAPANPPSPDRSAQPRGSRAAHGFVLVDEPNRAWTLVKIAGLVALTALSAALATAIIAGGVLFAVLNLA